ncbi:glycosyltransferase [Flavobacterium chuncheonense]|uniref:Glycosyltransferase n=1 Tax=Flavobacterium chuncheonense TaxID=2026653 RepID=A0ABW5YKZ0_9FLAO
MILDILFIGFAFFVLIQIIYYVLIFGKFSFSKPQNITTKNVPISVIVCAKNEEENITKFFPLLVSQNYSNYEIVLIDDASSDNTRDLFEEYAKQYPNVKVVKVDNNEAFWGNKKYALTLGIKAAKNDYLLFTDADCYPTSQNWITNMSSQFTLKRTIVLGYGSYEKIKNSFLNKIIRYETLLTATQYFAWAKIGKPYMGVGRNLAYHKDEFFKVRGFIDHMKVRSGDDDLFINQASSKTNTTICFTPDSFTCSKPKTTYASWFLQKRRHIATAKYYKSFDRFQLGLFYISQLSFLVLAFLLLAFQHQWIIVTTLITLRYLFTWLSMGYAAAKLNEKDVMYWYPFIEIFIIFTQLNLFFTNLFSKPAHWK